MSDIDKKVIKLMPKGGAEAANIPEGVVVNDFSSPDAFHELVKTAMRQPASEVLLLGYGIDKSISMVAELGDSVTVVVKPVKLSVHQQQAALCIIQDGIKAGRSLADIFNALAEVRFGNVQLLWETCAGEYMAGNAERAFSYFDYAFDEGCVAAIRVGLKLGLQDFGIDTAIRLLNMQPVVVTKAL